MKPRQITKYKRLLAHVNAWADGDIDSLLIVGAPGFGKTSAVQEAMEARPHHLFRARQSALEIYMTLQDAPNLPCVLDDIGTLLRDSNSIDLLKSLCETSKEKVLRWGSTTNKLDGRAKSFVCRSHVLIILNKLPSKNDDVMAVADRCDCIEFAPRKMDVLERMREIFPDDGELIELLGELPVMPTLRTLIKARQWRASKHLRLTEELFSECGVPAPVVKLLEIMQKHPQEAWCDLYVQKTGLTDRSFRRHKGIALEILSCRDGQTDIDLEICEAA